MRQRKWASSAHDDDITDYSPDGVAARADAARRRCGSWTASQPDDDVDVVTLAAMRERLGVQLELHDAGLDVGELNVIASPLQTMRDVFDLMATDTDDDWALISRRLSRCPTASRLRHGAARGRGVWPSPAVRQVARDRTGGQIQQLFVDMVADAAPGNDALHAELQQAAPAAADAYSRLAAVLRDEIGLHARGEDAFGRDAYRLFSRLYLTVDLDETYEWGLDLLQSIVAEQESIAHRLYPESSVAEALRGWTRSRAIWCRAPTPCRHGCRSCPIVSSTRWPIHISRSPNLCGTWNAGSRPPRPAESITPARPRI